MPRLNSGNGLALQVLAAGISEPSVYWSVNAVGNRAGSRPVIVRRNPMDRRAYLHRGVVLGVTVVAGCTERTLEEAERRPPVFEALPDEATVDIPVEQQFEVVAAGIEAAEDATFEERAAFESFLAEAGIAVERLAEAETGGERLLELECIVEGAIEAGVGRSVGAVAGGYAGLVRGGYGGDGLSASLVDSDGRTYGEFEVVTVRAAEYVAGEVTAAGYGGEVLHTLKSA